MPARLCSTLLALSLLAQPACGAEVPAASEVELLDQLGRSHRVSDHRDQVAVVLVVTARRLRNLRGWQRELQRRVEGVRFVLIADVPQDPPVTYEQVIEKLGPRIPEEVPVLFDLERRWALELELDTERPNILLLDRQGRLAARFRGRNEEALVDQVSRALIDLVGS